jgi:hypothetical protein
MTNLSLVLACIVFHEAGIASHAEMRAVGCVIWNRAVANKGESFEAMDLFNVVMKPRQFSCVRDRLLDTPGRLIPGDNNPAWMYAMKLGHALVVSAKTGRTDAFKVDGPQDHYYLRSMREPPTWARQLTDVVDHPYHRFGKLK